MTMCDPPTADGGVSRQVQRSGNAASERLASAAFWSQQTDRQGPGGALQTLLSAQQVQEGDRVACAAAKLATASGRLAQNII